MKYHCERSSSLQCVEKWLSNSGAMITVLCKQTSQRWNKMRQGDTHNQSAALSSSFSPDTYNRRAIRKSDEASSSPSSKKVLDVEFLLCNSCFWCASYYRNSSDKNRITKCPACYSDELESMPISSREVYKFDYNPSKGITLEFSRGLEKWILRVEDFLWMSLQR